MASTSKNADDVVVTCAIRTPLTKAFKVPTLVPAPYPNLRRLTRRGRAG